MRIGAVPRCPIEALPGKITCTTACTLGRLPLAGCLPFAKQDVIVIKGAKRAHKSIIIDHLLPLTCLGPVHQIALSVSDRERLATSSRRRPHWGIILEAEDLVAAKLTICLFK